MKNRQPGAELFHADGWEDMTILIITFHNFEEEQRSLPSPLPKKIIQKLVNFENGSRVWI